MRSSNEDAQFRDSSGPFGSARGSMNECLDGTPAPNTLACYSRRTTGVALSRLAATAYSLRQEGVVPTTAHSAPIVWLHVNRTEYALQADPRTPTSAVRGQALRCTTGRHPALSAACRAVQFFDDGQESRAASVRSARRRQRRPARFQVPQLWGAQLSDRSLVSRQIEVGSPLPQHWCRRGLSQTDHPE